MHEYDEVHDVYIVIDLLEHTSTTSVLTSQGEGQVNKVKAIGAESVCQNCVLGGCAHLHICIWLHNIRTSIVGR